MRVDAGQLEQQNRLHRGNALDGPHDRILELKSPK